MRKKRKLRDITLSTRSPGRTFGDYKYYGGRLYGILAWRIQYILASSNSRFVAMHAESSISEVSIFSLEWFLWIQKHSIVLSRIIWYKIWFVRHKSVDRLDPTDQIISEPVDEQVKISKNCEIFHHKCRHTYSKCQFLFIYRPS